MGSGFEEAVRMTGRVEAPNEVPGTRSGFPWHRGGEILPGFSFEETLRTTGVGTLRMTGGLSG